MTSPKRLLLGMLVAAALLLVPVAGAPFVAAGNPCYHGFEVPELTVSSATDVTTELCAFSPTVTVVEPGATVTFHNGPGTTHLVTGANADWGDRDIELNPGETVAYTFAEPGVYPYACTLHPGMSGAIVVGDGGPALTAAVAATGTASGTGSGTAPAPVAAAPAPVVPSGGPDPLVVAAIAGLAGAAVALVIVAFAARGRAPRPEPEAAPPTTTEPLTR